MSQCSKSARENLSEEMLQLAASIIRFAADETFGRNLVSLMFYMLARRVCCPSHFFVIGSALCLLFVLLTSTALGQSGRHLSKSPPVSVPTPEPKQPAKKPTADAQPKLDLIVGIGRGDAFSGISLYYSDSVLKSCADRLHDAHTVRVETVSNEMTRADAIKRARAEKEAYVVWLQLRVDSYSGNSSSNLDAAYVEYTVFEPTSAKVKTQGNCYQGGNRNLGGIIPRTNTAMIERRLRDAAQEAAERILKALNVALPSDIPPH
jgi:hypothetical protein